MTKRKELSSRGSSSGLTLIELLVVIAIFAMLEQGNLYSRIELTKAWDVQTAINRLAG